MEADVHEKSLEQTAERSELKLKHRYSCYPRLPIGSPQ